MEEALVGLAAAVMHVGEASGWTAVVPRGRRLGPLPAAQGQPRGRDRGGGRGRGGGRACASWGDTGGIQPAEVVECLVTFFFRGN